MKRAVPQFGEKGGHGKREEGKKQPPFWGWFNFQLGEGTDRGGGKHLRKTGGVTKSSSDLKVFRGGVRGAFGEFVENRPDCGRKA